MTLHLAEAIKKRIDFSGNLTFWCHKIEHLYFFIKNSLQWAENLIKCCYFKVGNLTVLQTIGIPMDIDPAPVWAYLYLLEHECVSTSK